MRQATYTFALITLMAMGLSAEDVVPPIREYHQAPDKDGVYYVGPEVIAPRLVRTVPVPYPDEVPNKHLQGMTVLAMVIDASGIPAHIQVLHKYDDAFDQAAITAVKQSNFEPGKLAGKSVPVWIDVRFVFNANRIQAVPQVLITERDLPIPDQIQFEDKHHRPLSFTPPVPIHTVDADFADPFTKNAYIQVAVVTVLVGEDGLPQQVRVRHGLGFGLDERAAAAVWRYRFLPATKKGRPVSASRDVEVSFAQF